MCTQSPQGLVCPLFFLLLQNHTSAAGSLTRTQATCSTDDQSRPRDQARKHTRPRPQTKDESCGGNRPSGQPAAPTAPRHGRLLPPRADLCTRPALTSPEKLCSVCTPSVSRAETSSGPRAQETPAFLSLDSKVQFLKKVWVFLPQHFIMEISTHLGKLKASRATTLTPASSFQDQHVAGSALSPPLRPSVRHQSTFLFEK